MKPLFSAEGAARLDAIVRPGLLCVFDFDGTLAPIVPQPDDAHLPVPVRERLKTLQASTPVAILTGRALADIRVRLDFVADHVIGNHGLEGLPGSHLRRAGFAKVCAEWHAVLQRALAPDNDLGNGLLMEDKEISLSVHYRHAPDHLKAQDALLALFATLEPAPRIIAGKFVFNLLPQGAGDKGTAFTELMALTQAPSALYVGDDVTDEDVFRLKRPDLLTIRIGDASHSMAEFSLRRHTDILRLLDQLIDRLGTPAEDQPKATVHRKPGSKEAS